MQKILSYMRKAIRSYNMIEDGDKIAVCLSGGKDSITMLMGLKQLQTYFDKDFVLKIGSILKEKGYDLYKNIDTEKNDKYGNNAKNACQKAQIIPEELTAFVTLYNIM